MLAFLCFGISVAAQTIDITDGVGTITINVGGELATAINTLADKASVTELQVSSSAAAPFEASDFTAINLLSSLKVLDLSGITTANYVIPSGLLNDNTTVETFIFPTSTNLGWNAGILSNCALKGTFTVPGNITNAGFISRDFLVNTPNITAFAAAGTTVKAVEDVLFNYAGNDLRKYPCGKQDNAYIVPEGVTNIGQHAFSYNTYLKKISFPATLASFQNEGAFARESPALEEIEVAEGNENYASMLGLFIKKSTNTILFTPPANTLLKNVETYTVNGSAIENIPASFFVNATNLKKISFSEGLKKIGANAFRGNEMSLETVYFPASLTDLGGDAFNGCTKMKTIVFYGAIPPTLANANVFRENGQVTTYKFNVYVPNASLNLYKSTTWGDVSVGIIVDNYKTHYAVTANNANVDVSSPTVEGIILAGDLVSATAEAAPSGQVFDKWEAQGVTIPNENDESISFAMPANDVVLTATYKTATGINTVEDASKINIYPNPATESVRLQGVDNADYAIYNIVGSIVAKGITNGEPISVSGLANGVYILKTEGKAIQFIKK